MIDYLISRGKQEVPRRLKRNPWSVTDHGRKLLQNNDELAAYMCAYGEMHKSKCFAALQNFPFDALPSTFEIVDWGCGQGIGTICLMDFLHERDLLNRLKRVTLIEPAQVTLNRAREYVSNALQGWNVEINAIQQYLPSNDTGASTLTELNLNLPGTIHLFSNILDITAVSLRKTAEIIASGRGTQFVVCVGPMNDNSPRIDEFSEYFYDKTIFSNISCWQFGITSDTHHPFSCKTKAFYFQNTTHSIANVTEGHYEANGAHDDYDLDAMVKRGAISQDTLNVYRLLASKLEDNDKIFLSPDLNGDKPDIIVVRPKKGIVILNVFDENLDEYTYQNNILSSDIDSRTSPLTQVYAYRTNLIEQHSKHLLNAAHANRQAWFIVRPAVWFTKSTRLAIESTFVNEKRDQRRPNIISGVATLSENDFNSNDLWHLLDVKYTKDVFTTKACNEVVKMLITQWHSYKEGDSSIVLTRKQKDLAKSYEGRQIRVKGVAGSGKTQVLASSAVLSQLRTGDDVLILTYNITLANYIRYRIRKVPADFPWNKFKITNYHNFVTMQAKNHGLKLDLHSYNDLTLFDSVKDSLPKFSAIFIDEAQDYEYDWFRIIYNNFLKEGGEFVIFGDGKQDVYKRGGYTTVPELGGRTWGRWNELKTRHRQNNQNIVDLCNDFQREFFEEPDVDDQEQRTLSFSNEPKYYNITGRNSESIADYILNCIQDDELDENYTVILSQNTSTVRNIDAEYREKTQKETTTTFESKEFYLEELNKANGNKYDERFIENIEAVRTNKKAHFTMMCHKLKLSTIYSYKGWEAENVFLVINNSTVDNNPEIIYTALTRAQNNLYLINLNNQKYHNFFQNLLG